MYVANQINKKAYKQNETHLNIYTDNYTNALPSVHCNIVNCCVNNRGIGSMGSTGAGAPLKFNHWFM